MEEQLRIIQDTREQNPWAFPCETVVRGLKCGDYSVDGFEDKIIIERKASTAELFRNIIEDRFWREIDNISELYPEKYLICEFPESYIHTYPVSSGIPRKLWRRLKIKPKFALSRITKRIIQKAEIPIIYCSCRAEAENKAYTLLKNFHAKNNKS